MNVIAEIKTPLMLSTDSQITLVHHPRQTDQFHAFRGPNAHHWGSWGPLDQLDACLASNLG